MDEFVGSHQDLLRGPLLKCPCRLGVDDKFELGRLLDWQISWVRAFQDLVDIGGGPPTKVGDICSVSHEPTRVRELTEAIHGGQSILRREFNNPFTVGDGERVDHDDKGLTALGSHGREGSLESTRISYLLGLQLDPELFRRAAQDGEVGDVRRIRRIPKNGHPRDLRTASLSSSSHLALNSSPREIERPVRLPPGLARLGTSPEPTGSPPMNTIGTVVVALFAARAAGRLTVRMTLGFSRISSPASSGKRSLRPSAHRASSVMFCPSTYPWSRSRCRNASRKCWVVDADSAPRNPTRVRGIDSCAWTESVARTLIASTTASPVRSMGHLNWGRLAGSLADDGCWQEPANAGQASSARRLIAAPHVHVIQTRSPPTPPSSSP